MPYGGSPSRGRSNEPKILLGEDIQRTRSKKNKTDKNGNDIFRNLNFRKEYNRSTLPDPDDSHGSLDLEEESDRVKEIKFKIEALKVIVKVSKPKNKTKHAPKPKNFY